MIPQRDIERLRAVDLADKDIGDCWALVKIANRTRSFKLYLLALDSFDEESVTVFVDGAVDTMLFSDIELLLRISDGDLRVDHQFIPKKIHKLMRDND